jgi:hypothetical protein
MPIPTVNLVDSLVLTLSNGPYILSKLSPIYSRVLPHIETGDEQAIQDLLALKYSTIYEAYDYEGYLLIREISDSGTKDILDFHPNNLPMHNNAIDDYSTLMGRFITKDELIHHCPEYMI